MTPRRSVVIVGGGFGGTAVVRQLTGNLPADVDLTLISEESYTTFNPLLPETVGASVFPEQVVAPLRELLMPDDHSRFIMAPVSSVDTVGRVVRCDTLGGKREIAYDHLVLAFGNRARLELLPGMAEHALPLSGLPAWLLWRAYYLSQMPTLRRKLRIFLEWTWGMFFPTDITHLSFRTSKVVQRVEQAQDAPLP